MFAILKSGGKQYRVSEGTLFQVEKLEAQEGASVTFNEVLLVGDGQNIKVGAPFLVGATITAELVEQKRDKKVLVFKKTRRHNYRRKAGHRQNLSVLKVTKIMMA
ncbi:50S ribosomal protein L21 [Alphaproteobacteria bacterium]|nr:50S ribosomal protein L21 [Alphaproteobacteria bacterium]GHS96517.1 50S ribosomal protein L21 [Alphaproteobacteria bacterium]